MIYAGVPGPVLLLPIALLATALFLFYWTRRTARSRSTITYRDETLTVRTHHGRKEIVHEWPRGAIRDIEVTKSTVSICDDGEYEVKIVAGPRTRQLLRGRPDHEKQWIVYELREALGMPASDQQGDA